MIQQKIRIDTISSAWWLIINKNDVLVSTNGHPLYQCDASSLPVRTPHFDDVLQIGTYNNLPCLVLDTGHEQLDAEHTQLMPLRQLMMQVDIGLFEICSRAWQVILFLRTHRYCGQCGSQMHRVDWELATHCNTCQHRCYPRISPCIIVAIRDQDKILLAQGATHKNGLHSTLAGFVESGETLEQAVHREVFEEVGIKVKNLRYFDSQPWPFPHSLMVGFLADYDSGDINIDEREILHADWFTADNLPLIPPTFSIAGKLIQATLELMRGQ